MITARIGTPPGFHATTCITVECLTCHEPFGDEDIGIVHFPSMAEARAALDDHEWSLTPTGPRCARCDTAALHAECGRRGHDWTPWRPCGCGCHEGRSALGAPVCPLWSRACTACHYREDATEQPDTHHASHEEQDARP